LEEGERKEPIGEKRGEEKGRGKKEVSRGRQTYNPQTPSLFSAEGFRQIEIGEGGDLRRGKGKGRRVVLPDSPSLIP